MTPTERAEKTKEYLIHYLHGLPLSEGLQVVDIISAQIAEAEREACHDCTVTHKNHKCSVCFAEGKKEGFSAARERAKVILREWDSIPAVQFLAQRIAAMEPESTPKGEKG